MRRCTWTFRASVGPGVGWGHLRRCVNLAEILREEGLRVVFGIDPDPAAAAFLRHRGFPSIEERGPEEVANIVKEIECQDRQVFIVDSYAIDTECLEAITNCMVVVIDDLADRLLPVDVVVNGAANAGDLIYRTLPDTRLLLGPEYILLRPEFARDFDRRGKEVVKRVFISVGGSDLYGLTPRLVSWVQEALDGVHMDVVIGPFFEEDVVQKIETVWNKPGLVHLYRDPQNIRQLMINCDLAITGGGQTTYELAATGTPAIAIRMADNQTMSLQGLSSLGALKWVGDVSDDDLERKVISALSELSRHADQRRIMWQVGPRIVDGRGAFRVAQILIEEYQSRVRITCE